jgi:predicted DNA-binding transcriptional regulator AlpA
MNKVQKLMSRKEARALTTLSLTHIDRLEKAGLFPQRVRLTNHPRGRCAYIYDEVIDFMTRRAQERADRSR